ncbi:hypothetical protein E0H47_10085 [Rhizobium leguminosarum bv. viciae]|uniref:hypothetical protein n=1 Tax=Rhizobium leguminosarum TaxID=384 RepID=UPI0010390968|nr:hypothetical protein [Rhizobium leguminosarum]TBZ41632.1 hypothetical protein E0H47_10085 [Rhizobium leguminosarum bv. viciae]
MKIRRDIASIPRRSAKETWDTIVNLISGPGSVDASTLRDAASIMQSLITDEHPAKVPIVVKGSGNRLVIYLSYGENAMDADLSVDPLTWNPTAGDWSMTAPSDATDVEWMNGTLKTRAPRVRVHDVAAPADGDNEDTATKSADLTFNWGALK